MQGILSNLTAGVATMQINGRVWALPGQGRRNSAPVWGLRAMPPENFSKKLTLKLHVFVTKKCAISTLSFENFSVVCVV